MHKKKKGEINERLKESWWRLLNVETLRCESALNGEN